MRPHLVAALLLLAPAGAVAQPSFECGKASTEVERTICGDAGLASADRELAALYGGLSGRLAGRARQHLVDDQLHWLADRGKACSAAGLAGCLTFRYRQRIATLKAAGEGPYPFVSEQALVQAGKVKAIGYEIDARYPRFDGGADFAAVNKAFADTAAAGAKEAVPAPDVDAAREQRWTYLQGFALHRPGPDAVSIETTSYIFTGGAHGSTTVTAALVDLSNGRSVAPSGVLKGDWQRAVSEIARADLQRQFAERPGFADALEPAKFDKLLGEDGRFLFKAGALEVIFNQYEVGPYAAGQYRVSIPYARLGGFIRPDGLISLKN